MCIINGMSPRKELSMIAITCLAVVTAITFIVLYADSRHKMNNFTKITNGSTNALLTLEERYILQEKQMKDYNMNCNPVVQPRQLLEVLVMSNSNPLYRHVDQTQKIRATVCIEHNFSFCSYPYQCKMERTEYEYVVANLISDKSAPNPFNKSKTVVRIRKAASCSCQKATGEDLFYSKTKTTLP